MAAIGGMKGYQMLKRRQERLRLSRWLNKLNISIHEGLVPSEILEYIPMALQIYSKANPIFLR